MSIARFLRKLRRQKCVYWENLNPDGVGGSVFAEPVELLCRWTDKNQVVVDDFNRQIVSVAGVMTEDELELGSYLMKGELNAEVPVDPRGFDGAFLIKWRKSVPDIKARAFLNKAYL